MSDLIREGAAGIVCPASGEEVAENLDRLAVDWHRYSKAARKLAEGHFGVERFLADYQRLYAEVLAN